MVLLTIKHPHPPSPPKKQKLNVEGRRPCPLLKINAFSGALHILPDSSLKDLSFDSPQLSTSREQLRWQMQGLKEYSYLI